MIWVLSALPEEVGQLVTLWKLVSEMVKSWHPVWPFWWRRTKDTVFNNSVNLGYSTLKRFRKWDFNWWEISCVNLCLNGCIMLVTQYCTSSPMARSWYAAVCNGWVCQTCLLRCQPCPLESKFGNVNYMI